MLLKIVNYPARHSQDNTVLYSRLMQKSTPFLEHFDDKCWRNVFVSEKILPQTLIIATFHLAQRHFSIKKDASNFSVHSTFYPIELG